LLPPVHDPPYARQRWRNAKMAERSSPAGSPAKSQFVALLLDPQPPQSIDRSHLADCVTLGLRRAGDVASAPRIVDREFDSLAAAHRFESHLRVRPIERAFEPAQIEMDCAVSPFHRDGFFSLDRHPSLPRIQPPPVRRAVTRFTEPPRGAGSRAAAPGA